MVAQCIGPGFWIVLVNVLVSHYTECEFGYLLGEQRALGRVQGWSLLHFLLRNIVGASGQG
jgi:hypothetical protein